jgi:Exostosin family
LPLKLHTDRRWLLPGLERTHVTILTPFWGRNDGVGARLWPEYADRLIESGKDFLELTPLEDAELAVFPVPCRPLLLRPDGLERAEAFAAEARAAGKPFAFFYDTFDASSTPFPIDDALVFRGSLFRSRRTERQFALPGFHADLLPVAGGRVTERPARGKPVISYCGVVLRDREPANAKERARRVLGDVRRFAWRLQGRHEEDLFMRARAIDALGAQDDVDTNIVVRARHESGYSEELAEERWAEMRREYVQVIVDSDYGLGIRNTENWSYRFYETLCLGRVPVIVDTDIVLPYDFLLPWNDYCVIVPRSDVDNIGARIAAFHDRLTPSDFVELQHECRRVWEDYLSPLGFCRNFHLHLDRHANSPSPVVGVAASSSST